MRNNSKVWLLALTLVLSIFLAACAGGSDKDADNADDQNKESGSEEAKAGGDLILDVLSDASSLDTHGSNDVVSSNIHANIYESLVKRNDKNEIEASLAEKWEQSDDVTWEFTLRDNVTFHDGEKFNAEAVKANLDRIRDPKVASPRFFLFEMVKSVDVVDDQTVRITTEYPFAPLLAHLSHNGGGMMSPKTIAADYEGMKNGKEPGAVISEQPAGTGYFKFESWETGSQLKLVKNEEYWDTPALVDSVTFKVVPESATRIADLETGYAHIADPVEPNEVKQVNDSDNATVNQKASSSVSYIGFNTEKAPFDDVKVRQAIAMLIDKEEIIEGVYEGIGIQANGPLAPGIFGYNEDVPVVEHNVEKAKELLKEAGYEDGFKTSIWTNDNQQRMDTAILVQQKLKAANIDVNVEVMEFGAYLEKSAAGEHDMFILGWSNPTGDADYGMYALFHSSQKGNPGNRAFYENPEVDKLLDEGRREADPEKRVELYNQVQEHLVEDAPMVFIHHQEYLTGISNKIDGFEIDTSGIYQLKNVHFVE
ncbi:glutathione ABC transporter substrate-binding protein [Lederbergia lenta]|uniref:Oligopeptide ABC transporter oligopeptide-binding protein n=1 Tax=Lederbergia lenta TaxID=1467 RepID=A0A2X4W2U0_LEDLE|nr:glutathione ABC transporter substrate-binding protein [Lederbergia lenta]MEC2326539.1 glutathione ABC transporter substrate-binding protein [Lederbergia lenta]SQI53212.1 oligopeptide ABC transporter oligopeptide-binding protein [Lederbergia lenta]